MKQLLSQMLLRPILCPFCFTQFPPNQALFRCENQDCSEPDDVYDKRHNVRASSPPKGHVITPRQGWTTRYIASTMAYCDKCKDKTRRRLCPECHHPLSHDAGMINNPLVAIIGARRTGKGHYFTTLIQRLKDDTGLHFAFSIAPLGEETRDRYTRDYYEPLYVRKEVLPFTDSARTNIDAKTGMDFRITFKQASKALNLTFFDSAGEDMQTEDLMSREARYIFAAHALIFLLDPLQNDSIRQRLGLTATDMPIRDRAADPEAIVDRFLDLFERKKNLSATAKVEIPVAFVVTKIDAIKKILGPESPLHRTGEHFGAYNLTDAQTVHTDIQTLFDTYMGRGFTNKINIRFSKYRFFGVSALGQPPITEAIVETVSPIRVEDPFLWLFNSMNYIKGSK